MLDQNYTPSRLLYSQLTLTPTSRIQLPQVGAQDYLVKAISPEEITCQNSEHPRHETGTPRLPSGEI